MKEIKFKKSDTVKVIAELASFIDSLDEKEYILTVKEHKQKRSLNANYFWELCGKLAEKTHIPKN